MALVPEVILAAGNVAVAAALQASRSVPIVFVLVPDPVGQGFVDSLARPGDNATGFTLYEFGMGGKWLELLKQMAPGMTRAGVLRDATTTGGVGQFAAIQSVAPSLGVEIIPINVRDVGEIERGVASVARTGNDGLIVTGSGLAFVNREMIVTPNPNIAMVQAAEDWPRFDAPDSVDGSPRWAHPCSRTGVFGSDCSSSRNSAARVEGAVRQTQLYGRELPA